MRKVPQEHWEFTPVSDAMTGISQATTVAPQDQVNDVLNTLAGDDVGETPVVEQGQLIGLLTRDGILSTLNRRRERRDAESGT